MNYSFSVPSVLILIVIMGYYFFRPRLSIRLNRAFLAILVIDIGTELFENIANRLNETWELHSPVLLWILCLLFFVFFLARAYMFFVFSISVLDARGIVRSSMHSGTPVPFFFISAIVVLSPLTRWFFWIDQGFHSGPLYFLLYVCSCAYILFACMAIYRHRKQMTPHEIISLVALQVVLLIGNIVRALMPHYIVMNIFSLMAIIVIFISFINPDLFLSERGYIYNLQALKALLSECSRRRQPVRILAFAIQNFNEHREIFGSERMDEAMNRINRYLSLNFPQMETFYLHNGYYALVSRGQPDLDEITETLRKRFNLAWMTESGQLKLNISFVKADTGVRKCPADRLLNAMLISLDEISQMSEPDADRSLMESIREIDEKLDIRRCLETALEKDRLEVFLQPLVDCKSGRRIAAEALVRLRDETGKIIRPDLFITLAEREGYIVRLGEQVLAKVCRFIRDNDMDALGIQWINVNLSPVQFMSRNIHERFKHILEQYHVNPDMIHLEITEQSMIDFAQLHDQITALHENGFQFALDDYGSGYSNLTRVRQYPFTNIKIDMEVVRNYYKDRDLLLPALVQAFKKMNFSVTAEGIETQEMAAALCEIGCDFLQGYYFSKPVPMTRFLTQEPVLAEF